MYAQLTCSSKSVRELGNISKGANPQCPLIAAYHVLANCQNEYSDSFVFQ